MSKETYVLEDGELRPVRPVRRAGDPAPVPETPIELGALLKDKSSGKFYRVVSRHDQSSFDLMSAPFFYSQSRFTYTRDMIRNECEILSYGEVFSYSHRYVKLLSMWKCRLDFFEGIFTVVAGGVDNVWIRDEKGRGSMVRLPHFLYLFEEVTST